MEISYGRRRREKRGVQLSRLNALLIVPACLISLLLLYATYRTGKSYTDMRTDTDAYLTCRQYAADMQAGSDYLTQQARAFAVTGRLEFAENYFEEALVTRRRDKALENLESYLSDTDAYRYLRSAMDYSNELMERECYAMRLVLESMGYDKGSYPEALRAVTLSPADAGLTEREKMDLAETMVFDETYQDYKEKINEGVSRCMETVVEQARAEQVESADRLQDMLRTQAVLIVVLLLIALALVVLTSRLVMRPLMQFIGRMREHQPLPVTGSSELRFLADTYNGMIEQTRRDQDQLSYEASHDVLTGLYNRSVFQKVRESCEISDVAMLIIDVDHFKGVNDTYGHDVGDGVLKRVAHLVQKSFRSEDYVCRIGGDEFAVIMVHVNSGMRELVSRKMAALKEALAVPEENIPAVTLSIGVAFGDSISGGDIYKCADIALYQVKEKGKNGCAFYEGA